MARVAAALWRGRAWRGKQGRANGVDGVWGKIIGGVAGFALMGPFGAVLGAAFGHAADSGGLAGLGGKLGADLRAAMSGHRPLAGKRDQMFAVGVVVLAAKLAKCDGPVVRAEIDAFKRCFSIPAAAARDIGRLFDHARDSEDDPRLTAIELGQAFADNRGMLADVLAALFTIARADRPLNRAEEGFLRTVFVGFALDEAAWARARDGQARPPAGETDIAAAYAELGLAPGASDETVRQTWRQLMRENHPDSLASRGVPAAFIASAHDKVARINAAWDRIKRERGL